MYKNEGSAHTPMYNSHILPLKVTRTFVKFWFLLYFQFMSEVASYMGRWDYIFSVYLKATVFNGETKLISVFLSLFDQD